MEPFRKMRNAPSIDIIPDEYLHGIFLDLLVSAGYALKEAERLFLSYQSGRMLRMVNKMFRWVPEEKLQSKLLFVRAAEAKAIDQDWQPNFENPVVFLQSSANHFEMLESAAMELVKFMEYSKE
jgi:hypothetical protein